VEGNNLMTEPDMSARDTERRMFEVRETARRESFRLACDSGAQIVMRPVFRGEKEPTVRDVEPLAGARAAHDLELSARGLVRDYIRQAREAGCGWDPIGRALSPDASRRGEATPAEAAYTYAVGRRESEPPWEQRYFGWTCRSCDKSITDRGLIQGPADDELGHADDCPRLAAAVAEWSAGWEAEP
jgi:hypothetical protein